MGVLESIREITSSDSSSPRFALGTDSRGLIFHLPAEEFDACRTGSGSEWTLHQFVCLKMLEEQGAAEEIRNGFAIASDIAVTLETEIVELLELPARFPGSFVTKTRGQTWKENFEVEIIPVTENGQEEPVYSISGPFLELSSSESYLLTAAQFSAFRALRVHKNDYSTPTETKNLRLVGDLQKARTQGMRINLSHFKDMEVRFPGKVSVSAVERQDGDITLIPSFGGGESPVDINNRLGNLSQDGGDASLRVGKQIISLDEKRLRAVNEIIENRHVRKDQVKIFLEAPGAFLDASLVDLDPGFSLRVHGGAEFRHAYFGETDKSDLSWFGKAGEDVLAPSRLKDLLETEEDLERFRVQFGHANESGAQQLRFDDSLIDISDKEQVEESLEVIKRGLLNIENGGGDIDTDSASGKKPGDRVVIDIALNDEDVSFGLEQSLSEVLSHSVEVDFGKYLRTPFSYQKEGIRWMLGLCRSTLGLSEKEAGKHGALLADDMGLGKTFMSLVGIGEYLALAKKRGETERPVLVVAPLSLLENWKDEIDATYSDEENPFDSIVILQANADLAKYRTGGGVETRQTSKERIRYSLKVGKEHGHSRLDMPRRVVLTSYQTLRDYQFSLSKIDWSVVVLDEAQFTKNPNALVTRAAKALKSRFKLLMTGTPVENHLGDFWCLVDTARPGKLHSYQQFRKEYIKPITSADDKNKPDVRVAVGRKLRMDIGATMLRRVKEDQLEGLPSKTIYAGERNSLNGAVYDDALACEMTSIQQCRYDAVIRTVQKEGGKGSVLSGLNRLQDVSMHPQLLDGGLLPMPGTAEEAKRIIDESGKLKEVFALLDKIKNSGEKVIVFVINKRLQSFLKVACEKLYKLNVAVINGDTKVFPTKNSILTRKSLITQFESAPGFGVIIMSPVAAGTGLNVVAANNVIHLQRHWNPAKEMQATDRVYRIGQKRDVNVYLPILHHPEISSFDINLNRLINRKSTMKDAVVTPEAVDPDELGKKVFSDGTRHSNGKETHPDMKPEYIQAEKLTYLSWEQFEAFSVELIAAYAGGEAKLTARGTDSGADGVVLSSAENILIQAKHTKSDRTIATDVSAEVYKARPLYENATGKSFKRLIAITNAEKYSRKVRSAAKLRDVELMTIRDIKKILKKHSVDIETVTARLDKERLELVSR